MLVRTHAKRSRQTFPDRCLGRGSVGRVRREEIFDTDGGWIGKIVRVLHVRHWGDSATNFVGTESTRVMSANDDDGSMVPPRAVVYLPGEGVSTRFRRF